MKKVVQMRRKGILLLLLVFVSLVTGCGSENTGNYTGQPDIAGYVMAKDNGDQDLLVVSPEGEEIRGAHETRVHYDALWIYSSPEEVEIGEYVRVWAKGGVEESYPGLATAGKVEVIPTDIPDTAA